MLRSVFVRVLAATAHSKLDIVQFLDPHGQFPRAQRIIGIYAE